jgi:hypothetical protein
MSDLPVDSPTLPTNDGKVWTTKQYSDTLTLDLTDDEILQSFRIIQSISLKWSNVFRTKLRHGNFKVEEAMKLVDQMEDELVTTLAEKMDLIATVDASPVFEGEPPVVELIGALPSHYSANFGLDHEKKEWEVKRAKDRGEAFLGSDHIE